MRVLTIFLALMFLVEMASGNLVEAHIIVSRYWLPALVHGSGPTQSTITRLNSSSTTGIGFRGVTGIL